MTLYEELIEYAKSKKGAYLYDSFHDGSIIVKVKNRIFADFFVLAGEEKVTLKCDPALSIILREKYPDAIKRGYHCPLVQQPYRNTILIAALDKEEIKAMIDHSYLEVLKALPKAALKELNEEA